MTAGTASALTAARGVAATAKRVADKAATSHASMAKNAVSAIAKAVAVAAAAASE